MVLLGSRDTIQKFLPLQDYKICENFAGTAVPSLRFNGHFPGKPGLAGVYWSKGWWRWWWQLGYWSYKSCKAPVKSSPTNKPTSSFLQARYPSCQQCQSTEGKNIIPWTCLPQAHLWVFQLCLWPITAPGYLGRGLPCLSSALWCQYPWWRFMLCKLLRVTNLLQISYKIIVKIGNI